MSFSHPLLLLSLLVLPAAAAAVLLVRRRRVRYAIRYTNLDVLARTLQRPPPRRLVPIALFLLALAACGVALARPHVTGLVPSERATVMLVIDVSRSMQATDVRPSRLAAAKTAALAFLARVPSRLRVGLIVFAGEPEVAAPPTSDHDLVRRSIDLVDTSFGGFGGTAIGDAIARAVEIGRQAVSDARTVSAAGERRPAPVASARGLVSIVFLSDGRQNRGILPPLAGAARAKAAGIPVYTIALGTPNGGLGGGGNFGGGFGRGTPDPATLRAIARATGGEFTEARTAETARNAYARLGSRLGRTRGRTEITYALVAAAAGLLVAAGALSVLSAPRLP